MFNIRNWLIKLLAGKRIIVVNAKIEDGTLLVHSGEQAFIFNTHVNHSNVELKM